ncbi:hypothetical protein DPMN_182703 [Dreissena polymorpha]|uniref:Uncharacterized protein n=1 Tax=Dreissena polymorpha TaxID=45954 RepID=A0A9D4DH10_DREPO|nr:hypothetical protein DPMN_182703 [Dreissena polymorpha]
MDGNICGFIQHFTETIGLFDLFYQINLQNITNKRQKSTNTVVVGIRSVAINDQVAELLGSL